MGLTKGGLGKHNLIKNRRGRIVSKKRAEASRKNPWIIACALARKVLNINACPCIKKNTPGHIIAKAFLRQIYEDKRSGKTSEVGAAFGF